MPLRLVHPVHRATHRIGLYLDDLGERGLTQGEAHILGLLAHSGPANVAELHRGLAQEIDLDQHSRSPGKARLDHAHSRQNRSPHVRREINGKRAKGCEARPASFICVGTRRCPSRQCHQYQGFQQGRRDSGTGSASTRSCERSLNLRIITSQDPRVGLNSTA